MTRDQLIKQGRCCGLGCMYCPYTPKHKKGTNVLSTIKRNTLKSHWYSAIDLHIKTNEKSS
jgi:sulfatase maturation enzyme AslB (radical SAM superfamily)